MARAKGGIAHALMERAENGDAGALSALVGIVDGFGRWKKAIDAQKEVRREAAAIEAAASAVFENAAEMCLPAKEDMAAIKENLYMMKAAWQDQKEAVAKSSVMREMAGEVVKTAAKKLEKASSDAAQLTLPGVER